MTARHLGRRHHRVVGLVATAVAVVGLTACADDDGGGTSSTSEADTPGSQAPSATSAATTGSDGTVAPATGSPSTAGAGPTSGGPPTAPPPSDPPVTASGADPVVTFTEVAALESPVDLAWRAGDDGLYVVEQPGRILRIGDGETRSVLDVTELTNGSGEQGLLGLAFDPSGELAYINYTDNEGRTVIGEYPVEADGTFQDGDLARIVLEIDQPYPNHNGGHLRFGPDGLLYIGMGDGGSGGDPERRATDMTTLLGKMLRIDPAIGDGQTYTVPADNPFVGDDDVAPEIWASGLRNPWRFSFDQDTGDLWIADVGQNTTEEIDVAPATDGVDAAKGLSFGWSAFEGNDRFNDDVPAEGHTPPVYTYSHDEGCSVSGGVRARGEDIPDLVGWYVFADYCAGRVWALEVTGDGASLAAGRRIELGELPSITAVVDGPAGELYVLSASGSVVRLDPA